MAGFLKKGTVETSALVGLASVLFIGFILFVFIKNSALVNVDVTAKETCKRSVQQYAKLKLPGIDLTRTDAIKCPTRNIQINSGDEETAKKGIAKAMYDCFDKFGAGELELFETRRGSTDNYCVVCSKLTFTDKAKEITGLANYLTTTIVPGKKYTYYEFLGGSGIPEEAAVNAAVVKDSNGNNAIDEDDSIDKTVALNDVPFGAVDTSKPYAVMFAYGKTTGWWDKLTAGAIIGGAGTATGVTIGVIVGGAVSGFFTGVAGWVATALFIAGAGAAGGAIVGGPTTAIAVVSAPYLHSDWQAGVLVMPYDETIKESLRRAGTTCGQIPVK